jgi:hypothetical protein
MNNGADTPHTFVNEPPIANRPDTIGERRWLDVHAQRRTRHAVKCAHERFAKVPGASGYEHNHCGSQASSSSGVPEPHSSGFRGQERVSQAPKSRLRRYRREVSLESRHRRAAVIR